MIKFKISSELDVTLKQLEEARSPKGLIAGRRSFVLRQLILEADLKHARALAAGAVKRGHPSAAEGTRESPIQVTFLVDDKVLEKLEQLEAAANVNRSTVLRGLIMEA